MTLAPRHPDMLASSLAQLIVRPRQAGGGRAPDALRGFEEKRRGWTEGLRALQEEPGNGPFSTTRGLRTPSFELHLRSQRAYQLEPINANALTHYEMHCWTYARFNVHLTWRWRGANMTKPPRALRSAQF